jgi:hypothetical protein
LDWNRFNLVGSVFGLRFMWVGTTINSLIRLLHLSRMDLDSKLIKTLVPDPAARERSRGGRGFSSD